MDRLARRAVTALAFALPLIAAAATFDHQPIAYFVPDKRIRIIAGIDDSTGVQLVRVYFKTDAQADYVFVPMQNTAGVFYVAMLPAPAGSVSSIEYLLLALNRDGQVSRTEAYKVLARKRGEMPIWQTASGQDQIKVFTEIPQAANPVAAYSDSITMDVVESGARFGTAAGLYAGTGSGATSGSAAASSGTSSTAATATSTTAATTTAATVASGGLSTAAIVGGVALAGVAAAAAGGGGGGSGGGGGGNGGSTSNTCPYTGSWNGTETLTDVVSGTGQVNLCSTTNCNCTWTGTVSTSCSFTYSRTCSGSSGCSALSATNSVQLSSTGTFQTTVGGSAGATCSLFTLQFSLSPRSVTGGASCTSDFASQFFTCHDVITDTFSGH